MLHHLQAHPWFRHIQWDKIYDMEAAYRPEVNDELDTQNFVKYDDEVESRAFSTSPQTLSYSFSGNVRRDSRCLLCLESSIKRRRS